MKERPILFNAEMVRAILEGRKTMTRRAIREKVCPIIEECFRVNGKWCPKTFGYDLDALCPFGKPGDRLWVRETFQLISGLDDAFDVMPAAGGVALRGLNKYKYDFIDEDKFDCSRWTPSIHMPRWASRITLEITDVRVERVQEISEKDAIAEGVTVPKALAILAQCYGSGTENTIMFRQLWDRIYKTWDSNPWVWVVEFKMLEGGAE